MVRSRKPQAASKPKLARPEIKLSAAMVGGIPARRRLAVAGQAACNALTTHCKKQNMELEAGEQQATAECQPAAF